VPPVVNRSFAGPRVGISEGPHVVARTCPHEDHRDHLSEGRRRKNDRRRSLGDRRRPGGAQSSDHRPGGTLDHLKTYEQGISQRTIVIEFDSVEQAIAAHDSPAYQEALAVLGNTCERDLRIVEGVAEPSKGA
jgi:Domain of unknown function (DUF1330)